MGTVTKRITAKGAIRYRALIQVRKQDINFSESKTFSKRILAETWIKKREAEIEINPEILSGDVKKKSMYLYEAIDRYIEDVKEIGVSKLYKLHYLKKSDFSKKRLDQYTREDFSKFTLMRRAGEFEGEKGIAKSTAEQDLYYLKSILLHADLVLNEESSALKELEKAMLGLRNARQIDSSAVRTRILSSDELQTLTNHFYKRWQRQVVTMPIHLIMWLAIYTSRRRGELFKLRLEDYKPDHQVWMVRNIKNPKGSKGNNKYFKVNDDAAKIINQLLEPEVRKKMMRLGGDDNLLIPLDASSVTRKFTEACRIYGFEDLCWHDLRHEAATRFAEDGLTIPQIQQYTLHDSWSSLQRYVNLDFIRTNTLDFDDAMVVANKCESF